MGPVSIWTQRIYYICDCYHGNLKQYTICSACKGGLLVQLWMDCHKLIKVLSSRCTNNKNSKSEVLDGPVADMHFISRQPDTSHSCKNTVTSVNVSCSMPVYSAAFADGIHLPTPKGWCAELTLVHSSCGRDLSPQPRDHNSHTLLHGHSCTSELTKWWTLYWVKFGRGRRYNKL